jgi:hypothetical protein
MKRVVTDILYLKGAPLAFNQISHKSKKYEGVCPWCASNIGKVKADFYGELVFKLLPLQIEHIGTCKSLEGSEIAVIIKG